MVRKPNGKHASKQETCITLVFYIYLITLNTITNKDINIYAKIDLFLVHIIDLW